MNRGVNLQSSPVQQMMAAGNPNWWSSSINNMRPPMTQASSSPSSFFQPPPPSFLIPQFSPNTSSGLALNPSWHLDNNNQELPESWSQLLLGGLVGEDDKAGFMRQFHQATAKKLESWEEQILSSSQAPNAPAVDVKQENGGFVYGLSHQAGMNHHHLQDFHQSAAALLSHQIMQSSPSAAASAVGTSSPPSSSVTSFSTNSVLDFSNKSDARHPPPHRPSDDQSNSSNGNGGGGAVKRARVHQSSSTPTTFKVRKEKLGDRITALHQLVSPFGKTDTASVLLEAIGYIRFLQSQIEALSLPYLGSGSGNMRQHHHPQHSAVHGERNCMFPEDPGQLLNENCMKRKGASSDQEYSHEEPKMDLRSRGLCLVPVSCTLQVGSDNGADYWAPAPGTGFQ